DENETRQMLFTGYTFPGPAAIRYPRGKGPGTIIDKEMTALEIGKARQLRKGTRIAILAFGSMVNPARIVADQLDASLIDMRFVKPLDEALIQDMAINHELIVTIEENSVLAGAGSGVSEFLHGQGLVVDILHLGVPDRFISQDKPDNMLAECGLNVDGILESIRNRVSEYEKNSSMI
ncbi:MAG: 1-deoxy-D-xylulose-5-phosphate synthase, partial [Flavobacterium sp.]